MNGTNNSTPRLSTTAFSLQSHDLIYSVFFTSKELAKESCESHNSRLTLPTAIFVSFPQKRNGIVFSSGVNYLHSGDNIQSELSS